MPLFALYHMECDTEEEAKTVSAKDYLAALQALDPVFRYDAGDCDSWSGVKPHLRHMKPLHGTRPKLIAPGTEPRSLHVDGSIDYFCLYERKLP
ncbi:MAG: hypothetical protein WC869_00130 [Phycisphaerae bacterium]|jgi:hypothetical protein